jgi:septum formation inhibitor-activating ATPase MinD
LASSSASYAASVVAVQEPPDAPAGEPSGEPRWPEPEAVAAVLRSAVREYELVVVDLSRRFGPAELAALRACRSVVVVVPAEVRATAAATAVCGLLDPVVADQRLVVRGPAPSGLAAEAVADVLGLPLAGELRSEPGVAAALDRGEPLPDRPRGALTLLSRRLVAQVLAG